MYIRVKNLREDSDYNQSQIAQYKLFSIYLFQN